MVEARRIMVKELPPEIKYARKILISNKLAIPFDLFKLVSKYVEVVYKNIPIQRVDGISHNLKTPGKKPVIIINSSIPETRQRFTLAHEFGHMIIPWHLGTIADEMADNGFKEYLYRIHESEANNFAAEILMPFFWIEELLKTDENLSKIHELIVLHAKVSPQAAAIRLLNFLPKNCIYIAISDNVVVHSGCSDRSEVYLPSEGSSSDEYHYEEIDSYSFSHFGSTTYGWYKLKNVLAISSTNDTRTWMEILSTILADVNIPVDNKNIKQSINGVISCANGRAKTSLTYSPETLKADCIHRLNNRDEFRELCNHKDFMIFIDKRIMAFFAQK